MKCLTTLRIGGDEWLEWLHKRRAEAEQRRQKEGISGEEWLRRIRARADRVFAELQEHEQPSVARDRKPGD